MRRAYLVMCILCAAACLLGAPSSRAGTLSLGATLYPAPGETDPTVGVPLAFLSVPFSAAPLYTGKLAFAVYDNDTTNPYSGLTFVYEVSNDPLRLDAIHRLTVNNFSGVQIDASDQSPSAGLAATLITRASMETVVGFVGH